MLLWSAAFELLVLAIGPSLLWCCNFAFTSVFDVEACLKASAVFALGDVELAFELVGAFAFDVDRALIDLDAGLFPRFSLDVDLDFSLLVALPCQR